MRHVRVLLVVGAVVGLTSCAWMARSSVSSNPAAVQGDGASGRPSLSQGGRFVAFESAATNLVPGDTNGVRDVFVRDHVTGATERVSVATGGAQGTGASGAPAISDDGRFVAFRSHASNLVAGDTNAVADAFVRDRTLGRTIRLSVSSTGEQGDLHSFRPHLSASGRVAVFRSYADNLVDGDTNAVIDVFVRDLARGQTIRVSMSSAGEQANERPLILPCISGDGRRVVFGSLASNLVGGDTNHRADVFLYDRQTGRLRRVSVGPKGRQANGASERARISGDGRTIVFPSRAGNLVAGDRNGRTDVFVRSLTI
jgi:Tol biopolymer transport system component